MRDILTSNNAQIQTLEAFGAVFIMIAAIIFSYQGLSTYKPQTEKHVDIQLIQYGRDALVLLDASNETAGFSVLEYSLNKANNTTLNKALKNALPSHIQYNVKLSYQNETEVVSRDLSGDGYFIKNGMPVTGSVGVSHAVSIFNPDNQTYMNVTNPVVVEVKLILWNV